MSASIESVVKVLITKGTRQVPIAGFGTGLILAPFTSPAQRVLVYQDYTDFAVDFPSGPINAAGLAYFGQSVQPTSLVVGAIQGSETPVQALAAVQALNNTWYALMLLDHTKADVLAMAAVIETQKKIFITSSQDPHVIGSQTDDVATALKALNYTRSAVLYSAEADTKWPEAAWLGRMLPTGVGAATWKFKTLAGVDADNLSGTAIANAQTKNSNIYTSVGGVDITLEGIVASGEFIDVTRLIDWLVATMEVNVYSLLINNDKVPYTNKGIATIENAVRQTLQQGVDHSGIAIDPAYTVSVPDVLAVSQADKASRTLNGVVFTCTLAGAIHKVNIQGFVSV